MRKELRGGRPAEPRCVLPNKNDPEAFWNCSPRSLLPSSIILFSSIQNNFFSITIIGSFFLLVYAYIVRFLAVGISPIKSNFIKQPDSLNDTAKNLGLGPIKIFQKIQLPISKLALISAFTITFVDLLKELPITLILRPFNFDTLATQTYQFAIEEMLIESSIFSLLSRKRMSSLFT